MVCNSGAGMVWFGYCGCIAISPDCNVNSKSHNKGFGLDQPTYVNDTGLPGSTLFTGEQNYVVKELEIFEIRA
jgi:hypothetical protein